MSVETIERIHRDFMAGVDEACATGRGGAHLLNYFGASGRDFAGTIFLQLATKLEEATEETAPALLEWGQSFPEIAANLLAEGVRETFSRLGFGHDPFVEEAEEAAVTAFAERLDLLFEVAQPGGAA